MSGLFLVVTILNLTQYDLLKIIAIFVFMNNLLVDIFGQVLAGLILKAVTGGYYFLKKSHPLTMSIVEPN